MGHKIRLGVNIDHVATLRQVRGGTTSYPDLLNFAKICKKAGAQQITVHLREDRRHIQDRDVQELCAWRGIPINLEMACSESMIEFSETVSPEWICLVPEKRAELTTEGGLNLFANQKRLKVSVQTAHRRGGKVSFFIDPDPEQIHQAHKLGADAIELHTGTWVLAKKGPAKAQEFARLKSAAKLGQQLGLGVHAGHGLDFKHARLLASIGAISEHNIGHSLICYALEYGLKKSIRMMRKEIDRGSSK